MDMDSLQSDLDAITEDLAQAWVDLERSHPNIVLRPENIDGTFGDVANYISDAKKRIQETKNYVAQTKRQVAAKRSNQKHPAVSKRSKSAQVSVEDRKVSDSQAETEKSGWTPDQDDYRGNGMLNHISNLEKENKSLKQRLALQEESLNKPKRKFTLPKSGEIAGWTAFCLLTMAALFYFLFL